MSSNKPIAQRFWEKVDKSGECWEWKSIKNAYGYGVFCKGPHGPGRRFMAHRIAYELTYGPFEKELYVCHKCDNRGCVRPDHLFLGTQKDNMTDCLQKGRSGHDKLAKAFSFIDPQGNLIQGKNLRKFCRENNLCRPCMVGVSKGHFCQHKGYTRAP